MAVFRPSLDKIKNFKVSPTAGEQEMLDFLDRSLDDSYEVFFQPHLNGLLPDFVIVHKDHGILVIEVKDYHLDSYQYVDDFEWEVYSPTGEATIRSPFYQAKLYKDALCNLYFRQLSEKMALDHKYYAVISAGVFFSEATHEEIQQLLGNHEPAHTLYWGEDDLSDFDRFFANTGVYFTERKSKNFSDDLYEEAVRVLQPDNRVYHHKYLPDNAFDKQRRSLIRSHAKKEGKVRGVAGSGKTEILVRRAVAAYRRTNSPVLITMFNITMRNYMQDRLNDVRGDIPRGAFDIVHYHALTKYYDPEKARRHGKYKAIFVDEVQDFARTWIDDLRNNWLYKADDDWEIFFFGDEKQRLYEGADMIQEGKVQRPYTGVSGNWNELKTSFRLDSKIALFATAFLKNFAADKKDVDDIVPALDNLFDDSQVSYCRMDKLDCPAIYQMYRQIVQKSELVKRPNDNDIVFLGSRVQPVRLLEQYFRNVHRFRTTTTFETQEQYDALPLSSRDDAVEELRRSRKFNFWPESGTVKFSTIHSFKGWEIETVFLIIDDQAAEEQLLTDGEQDDEVTHITPELLYTAFTRAIRNLVIIEIGKSRYTSFFKDYFKA